LHKNTSVKTPALRTIGNLVTGDDLQTQIILNFNVLPCLLALLGDQKRAIRKETCWAISNITAGNAIQIQAVIDANIIPPLISILRNGVFEIQKEATWAISNATSGGADEQIRYLASQGVIAPFCDLFACPDPRVAMVVLEAIENILRVGKSDAVTCNTPNRFCEQVEECGGLDKLEEMQRHGDRDIYDKAVRILRNYFESDEAEDETSMVPEVGASGHFVLGGEQEQRFSFPA